VFNQPAAATGLGWCPSVAGITRTVDVKNVDRNEPRVKCPREKTGISRKSDE
jgi:hypothetical protein